MTGKVIQFGRRRPPPRPPFPPAPTGAEVHICDAQDGGFLLYDISASGGSAGTHGYFSDHAEAVAEGQRLAERIGGTFSDLSASGGEAA